MKVKEFHSRDKKSGVLMAGDIANVATDYFENIFKSSACN